MSQNVVYLCGLIEENMALYFNRPRNKPQHHLPTYCPSLGKAVGFMSHKLFTYMAIITFLSCC